MLRQTSFVLHDASSAIGSASFGFLLLVGRRFFELIENAILLAFLHFGFRRLRWWRLRRTTVFAASILSCIRLSAVVSSVLTGVLSAVISAVISTVVAIGSVFAIGS